MLIEGVIGNLKEEDTKHSEKYKGKRIDYVDIEWYETHKKVQRKTTYSGVEVGFCFGDAILVKGLKQDDVLYQGEQQIIAVNIPPCDALVIKVENHYLLPKVCYEIGNKHMPFFRGENKDEFVTPYDKPLQVLINKLGIKTTREQVSFDFNKAISSNMGGHHH